MRSVRSSLVSLVSLAVALCLAVPAIASARAGRLDTTFGTGGVVTVTFRAAAGASSVALWKDGSIALAGFTGPTGQPSDIAVLRLHANGNPIRSFGHRGVVQTDLGGSDSAAAVGFQPDGKLVVAGSSGGEVALVRYEKDGTLDPAFGDNGVVLAAPEGAAANADAMSIQSDGKIVVAGLANSNGKTDFLVARFLANGQPDTGFGTDGFTTTPIGSGTVDIAYGVATLSNAKVIAVGTTNAGSSASEIALAQYTSGGDLDGGFGDGGIVTTPAGDRARALAVDATHGVIAVAVRADGGPAVAEYQPNGLLEPAFGRNGIAAIPALGSNGQVNGVVQQPDGRIVVVGGVPTTGAGSEFAVARLLRSGGPDPSFGHDGATTSMIGQDSFANGVALQADGRIVAAGIADGQFAAARYMGAHHQPDATIRGPSSSVVKGNGVYDHDGSRQTAEASAPAGATTSFAIRVQNDGDAPDRFTVRASPNVRGFTVRYFAGGREVTGLVLSGFYTIYDLRPGHASELRAAVTVWGDRAAGFTRSWTVGATSVGDSRVVDVVRLRVRSAGA